MTHSDDSERERARSLAIRLEMVGYLPQVRALVAGNSCPVWWFDDDLPEGKSILASGTVTLIHTGERVLAITAHHVYRGYETAKQKKRGVRCQVGNVTVELEKYVAWERPDLDLVAFNFPPVLTGGTGASIHYPASWPQPKLRDGDLVALGGYPVDRLRTELHGAVNFSFASFFTRVAQASDDHFAMSLDLPNALFTQGRDLGQQPDLGGMSGGPVYLVRTSPIETIEFAGVIYEGHRQYELLFARHAAALV